MTLLSCIINKQETDAIQRGLIDRQMEDKMMLGQIYQNQIDQARKIKDNDSKIEKEIDRMQIERAMAVDPNAYNRLKKKAFQQEVIQERDQKNKLKQYDNAMREHSVRESKKMMEEYAKREIANEQDYRNKFSKYDQNMQKRMHDYNSYVMKPSLEKKSNMDLIERKNIDELNRRQEENEMRQDAFRRSQVQNTSNELKNQMNEKSKMNRLNSELGQIENKMTSDRAYEINTFDQMLKDDKKKRQEMYRQMLQSQVQYNNGLKNFGNMTKVEKMMNRDDLKAYKKFDNNQYSMIPGINTVKKYPKGHNEKSSKVHSYDEDQRRLETYGYGRYLNKVPTSIAPIENYGGGLPKSRQASNGFNQMNRSQTGSNLGHRNNDSVKDLSAAPNSRRHQMSPRAQASGPLRNAGAVSMTHENHGQRAAGSPSAINHPYGSQVL